METPKLPEFRQTARQKRARAEWVKPARNILCPPDDFSNSPEFSTFGGENRHLATLQVRKSRVGF
jgi:hypothetical protein